MTTPVTYSDEGQQTVSFVMPSEYKKETLPKSNDSNVEFVDVPEQIVAVRRFSRWSNKTIWHEQRELLLKDLERANITVDGLPVLAQYDLPWTAGPLRRNEVLVRVILSPKS